MPRYVDIESHVQPEAKIVKKGWFPFIRLLLYYTIVTSLGCLCMLLLVSLTFAGVTDVVSIQVGLANKKDFTFQSPQVLSNSVTILVNTSRSLLIGILKVSYVAIMSLVSGLAGVKDFMAAEVSRANITEF